MWKSRLRIRLLSDYYPIRAGLLCNRGILTWAEAQVGSAFSVFTAPMGGKYE
jgi:hypothetical protein